MLPYFYKNKTDYYTKKRTLKNRCLNKNICRSLRIRNCYTNSNYKGILKFLAEKHFLRNDYQSTGNTAILKIPKKFSFTENPKETLHTLQRLVGMFENPRVRQIYIDHRECEELEVSASLMMDTILYELDTRRRMMGMPVNFFGALKNDADNSKITDVQDVLIWSGVLKHLNVIPRIENPNHIETLDFYDDYIKCNKNIEHDEAGQKVAEYFNRCYNKIDFEISEEGITKISDMVAEIVLNCDNHSGNSPRRWFCQGHYHINSKENTDVGECQLTIISIGDSFYESINNHGTEFIKGKLKSQYKKIEGKWKNLLDIIRKGKEKELYYLLFCLQENISRFQDKTKDRGKGTVTLFENFQELGKTMDGKKPILSITSGSSQIIFDGTYKMSENEKGIRIIAFNESNDLNIAPDGKYVHNIDTFFPGVVINLKFYIDRCYLEKVVKK